LDTAHKDKRCNKSKCKIKKLIKYNVKREEGRNEKNRRTKSQETKTKIEEWMKMEDRFSMNEEIKYDKVHVINVFISELR